jgi:hypothetical protein
VADSVEEQERRGDADRTERRVEPYGLVDGNGRIGRPMDHEAGGIIR